MEQENVLKWVTAARTLEGYLLHLTFNDGSERIFDCLPLALMGWQPRRGGRDIGACSVTPSGFRLFAVVPCRGLHRLPVVSSALRAFDFRKNGK